MEYLTLPPNQNQILNTRTGAVWAEIAPFSVADVPNRAVADSSWPQSDQLGRLIVLPGEASADGSDDDISKSFRAWSGSGKEELEVGMRVLVDISRERDCELLVWPRIGSLVSDIPGLLSLSRKYEDVGILLEPAALFPPGDQFRLTDFVERFAEVMPVPAVCAIFFDAESAKSFGGLAVFAPLVRLASDLERPVVLRGISPEDASAIFGLRPG